MESFCDYERRRARERERALIDWTDCLSIMEEEEVLPVRGGDEAQIWRVRIFIRRYVEKRYHFHLCSIK